MNDDDWGQNDPNAEDWGGGDRVVDKPFYTDAGDIAKSATVAPVKGMVAGAGGLGDVRDWGRQKLQDLYGWWLGQEGTEEDKKKFSESLDKIGKTMQGASGFAQGIAAAPTSQQVRGTVEGVTGKLYEPQSKAGELVSSPIEFATNPTSYIGPGGMAAKAVTAAAAGLGSEAAGQATEGTEAEFPSRIAGAITGALLPRGLMRAVTPNPMSPQRQRAVGALESEGVVPTAGQKTGSDALKYIESDYGDAPLAGGLAKKAAEKSLEQYTNAALKRVDRPWNPVKWDQAKTDLPEVIKSSAEKIGNRFDTLAARNSAPYDLQYLNEVLNARQKYTHLFFGPLTKPVVEQVEGELIGKLSRGTTLEGSQYKALRSRIDRMQRSTNNDPELKQYLMEVRNSMDDLMERSIAANNPRDIGAWKDVRRAWANQVDLEAASLGSGEMGSQYITPPKLKQAATKTLGDRTAYARGIGDLSGLARAGNVAMTPMPQSGTTPRAVARAVAGSIAGGGLGYLAGENLGHEKAGSAIGTGLGLIAGPAAAGKVIMSRPAQRYLSNQVFTRTLPYIPSKTSSVLRSLPPAVENQP